jgi:hypothetical protein
MGKARTVAVALALALAISGASAARAATPQGVIASFTYTPAAPLTGQVVAFSSTSTATGANNQVTFQIWDLDGDGRFNDAIGTTAARAFPAAGTYNVSLRAYDEHGHSAVATQAVTVSDPPPPAPQILTPFPVVRMAGKVTRRGTRLRRLSVEAPRGSAITVRCHGHHRCPLRKQALSAAYDFHSSGLPSTRMIRIRRLEHRLLRAGVVIKVFVTKPGMIGKFARFRVRRHKPPARTDGCVLPGVAAPTRCPTA